MDGPESGESGTTSSVVKSFHGFSLDTPVLIIGEMHEALLSARVKNMFRYLAEHRKIVLFEELEPSKTQIDHKLINNATQEVL